MSKAKAQSLYAALDEEFGWSRDRQKQFSNSSYPWRDEDDDFFTPLPLDKFLHDHLGVKLFPAQEEDLLAILGTDPKMAFEAGNGLPQQGLLVWGKGSGKDFVVSCLMLWAVQVLLCLKDPAVYLGQAHGENIDILTVAYSKEQAVSVLFYKIKARLKACGWMRTAIAKLVPDIPPERYLKEGNGFVGSDNLMFPGNLRMWSVPATDAAEGKNPIIWCADEIAAFASPARMNQAAHIHKVLTTSARTRFQDRWKGFCISYPRHRGDYLMHLVDLFEKKQIHDTYASIRASWEVNLNVTRASLQADYDRDPEGSACAYECKPPAAVDAYFRSPELLLLHCSGAPLWILERYLDLPEEHLEAIANLGQCPILETDSFGDPLLDRRGFPKLARWLRGQKNPAGDPYEYFIHVDPGLSGDAFGFAMGHVHQLPGGGFQPVIDLAFRWTGAMFHEFGSIHRQAWFLDTKDQTETIMAREVDFRTVREFVFFLKHARGFNIELVTVDTWNSAESIQELRKRDVPVSERIVNKEDYDEYKSLVYNRQLRYYGYPILIEETLKLQLLNGTRVEAPRTAEGEGEKKNSHKDVSDAVAAVCRLMVLTKDETVEFYSFPAIETIWEKAERKNQPVDVAADREVMNEAQQKIMARFFAE